MSDPLPCPIVAEHPDWVPRYQTAGAACADLRAWLPDRALGITPGATAAVDCGFSMALPAGWKAEISARSGLAAAGLVVANAPGQVDEDYRGRVKVLLVNEGRAVRVIEHGDRIAQMWLSPVHRFAWVPVAELDATGRGAGGFGSTGAGGGGPDEPERADLVRLVWRLGNTCMFSRPPWPDETRRIKVPFGWRLSESEDSGVVYRDAFGRTVGPGEAWTKWRVPDA